MLLSRLGSGRVTDDYLQHVNPIEALEARVLLAATVTSPVRDAVLDVNGSTVLDLFPNFNDTAKPTTVRINTNQGNFDVRLFDAATPRTVQNFVHYIQTGRYNSTVIHRSINDFIIQGGGYALPNLTHISEDRRVANEFGISNTRGTIAMAKLGDEPSSATSEFFINTADNSANLDNQNSGFTAFGQVLGNGMQVVDAINALATTTLQAPFPALQDFPVTASPPSGTADFVKVNSVSLIPELTISAVSDNPAVATVSVSGTNLTLNAGATPGVANVTLNATDADGNAVADTLAVTVGTLDVTLADAGPKAVTFTDADGTKGTITLKGGAATVRFAGTELQQAANGKGVTVTGNGIHVASIAMTGTSNSTALTIKAKGGDGVLQMDGITADGALKSIAARPVAISGDIVVGGALGKLDLRSLTRGRLDLGGTPTSRAGSTLNIGDAQDADIVSDGPIKALKTNGWSNADTTTDLISAPFLTKLTVKGDFSPSLDLGGLGSGTRLSGAKIGGELSTGTWRVLGDVGKIAARSVASSWAADVTGDIGSLAVNRDMAGNVSASSLKSVTVGGTMTGTNLTLTQALSGSSKALGKLTVKGQSTNIKVRSGGNLGALSFGGLADSTVYAGVNTDGGALPSALTDFTTDALIAGVTIKGGSAQFVDSDVAAKSLGKINLGTVTLNNAAVPFGVAADRIAALSGEAGSGNKFKLAKLDDPADAATRIVALGSLQDFSIRVF